MDLLILFKHSVGLLWTSNQPVAKASTYTQRRKTRKNIYALSGIRTRDSRDQAIKTARLRDRHITMMMCHIII
jgi:hypothetical protein